MNENIEAFLAIVRFGSISQAANNSFVSQPALTSRLKKLEDSLGVKLFVRGRGSHQLQLTEAGSNFLPIAIRWENLLQEISTFSKEQSRPFLRIISLETLNNLLLMPFFKNLALLDPPMDLTIKTGKSAFVNRSVAGTDFDIGFIHGDDYSRLLNRIPLFEEPFCLISSSSSLAGAEAVTPSNLDMSKEILMKWTLSFARWHDYCFGTVSRPHLYCDSVNLYAELLTSGDFWSIAPLSVAMSLEKKGICKSDLAVTPPPRSISILTKKSYPAETSITIDRFIFALKEYLRTIPGITCA